MRNRLLPRPKTPAKTAPSPLRLDPSRTAGLRKSAGAKVARALAGIKYELAEEVVTRDALGLASPPTGPTTTNALPWGAAADRLKDFANWSYSVAARVLKSVEDTLQSLVDAAFRKGLGRAWESKGKYPTTPTHDPLRTDPFAPVPKSSFVESTLRNPVAKEQLDLLKHRTSAELEILGSGLVDRLQRTAADAVQQGLRPKDALKLLAAVVDQRADEARVTAADELVRAQGEGLLTGLDALGVPEVFPDVEWTLGRSRSGPCKRCAAMKGTRWTITAARGKIPVHRNCRCSWTPVTVPAASPLAPPSPPVKNHDRTDAYRVDNYRPDQPRAPKGSKTGGRFVRGVGAGSVQVVKLLLDKHKAGTLTGPEAKTLHDLTLAHLADLARDSGHKLRGRSKAEKVANLAEHLANHKPVPSAKSDPNHTPVPPRSVLPSGPILDRLKHYPAGDAVAAAVGRHHVDRDEVTRAKAEYAAAVTKHRRLEDEHLLARVEKSPDARRLGKDVKAAKTESDAASVRLAGLELKEAVSVKAGRDEFDRLLTASKSAIVRVDGGGLRAADEGGRWLAAKVEDRSDLGLLTVTARPTAGRNGDRAHYSRSDTTSYLGPHDGAGTAVHEFGHAVEWASPRLQKAANEFLAARTAGEPLTTIFQGTTEQGRKDRFGAGMTHERQGHYVGKHYDHGSTEIVSMGFEQLHRDPAKFAAKDPEYFKFLVATMRGEL